jgi:hypothetical protein
MYRLGNVQYSRTLAREPIVPRVKKHIRKSDLTKTETFAQDNRSTSENEVYIRIGEASPVFQATKRP